MKVLCWEGEEKMRKEASIWGPNYEGEEGDLQNLYHDGGMTQRI